MHNRQIHYNLEMLKAENTGSRDPMDADGKFLYEISLNTF